MTEIDALREKTEQPTAWAYSIEGYGSHVCLERPEPSPKVSDLVPLFTADEPGLWRFWNEKAQNLAGNKLRMQADHEAETADLRQQLAEAREDCKRANEMINAAVTDYNEAVAEIKARSEAYDRACRERDEARDALQASEARRHGREQADRDLDAYDVWRALKDNDAQPSATDTKSGEPET